MSDSIDDTFVATGFESDVMPFKMGPWEILDPDALPRIEEIPASALVEEISGPNVSVKEAVVNLGLFTAEVLECSNRLGGGLEFYPIDEPVAPGRHVFIVYLVRS